MFCDFFPTHICAVAARNLHFWLCHHLKVVGVLIKPKIYNLSLGCLAVDDEGKQIGLREWNNFEDRSFGIIIWLIGLKFVKIYFPNVNGKPIALIHLRCNNHIIVHFLEDQLLALVYFNLRNQFAFYFERLQKICESLGSWQVLDCNHNSIVKRNKLLNVKMHSLVFCLFVHKFWLLQLSKGLWQKIHNANFWGFGTHVPERIVVNGKRFFHCVPYFEVANLLLINYWKQKKLAIFIFQ